MQLVVLVPLLVLPRGTIAITAGTNGNGTCGSSDSIVTSDTRSNNDTIGLSSTNGAT